MSAPQAERARSLPSPAGSDSRLPALDRFRGLAIVAMLVDHLAFRLPLPDQLELVLRLSVGRVAMPMFFLLAGYLARRVWSGRYLDVAVLGLLLPVVAPWIDAPNVLLWWVLGAILVAALRRLSPVVPVLLPLVGLSVHANGWAVSAFPHSYEPLMLLGLMGLGAVLPVSVFAWAGRLPAFLGVVGRHPVAWYAGHILVLTAAGALLAD